MIVASGSIWTILVAAGRGTRFGGEVPKQFVTVAGRRIIDWSMEAASAASDGVVVVLPADRTEGEFPVPAAGPGVQVRVASGGTTRSASVRAGLAVLPDHAATVLVHDAARPLASPDLFERVASAVRSGADGAVPTVPLVDTIRRRDGRVADRREFAAVQTPQGFTVAALRAAHDARDEATDDATLVTLCGGQVVTVPGERWNLKVTDPADELVVAALLEARR